MGIGFRIGIILGKEQSVKIQHPESGNAEVINIVVCMKIVIDPEAPFSVFRIDRENKKPVPPSGVAPVFGPFDENALESALKIEGNRECRVTVLSLGKTIPKALLQKALAAGVDEAIAVEDPQFENLDPSRVRTKFIEKTYDESLSLTLNLASASVVVSGGRGLRKKEDVDLLKKTATLIGGAIAGSRAAVDSGWLPSSLQVGLTGKRINPRLYMAVGISGALQHMAGCMRSKTIVAINSDESAPIFDYSHIGVLGDYRGILEVFNDEIRKIVNALPPVSEKKRNQ